MAEPEIIQNDAPETVLEPVPFNWTLNRAEWTTTIFAKKKMRERCNIRLIYGFIKAEMGIAYGGISRYSGMPSEIKTELDLVKNYKNLWKEKEKYFSIAHTLPKHKWGRTIPNKYLSLSIFHRPTRHRLCADDYIDIDIKNAQPQVTNDICLQNGIENVALTKYVANPKKYRLKIAEYHGCSPDTAKNLPISLMFGGKYASWIKENNITKNDNGRLKLFLDIENEMAKVSEIVYKANPHIVKDVKKHNNGKWKNANDEKRGCMAIWSQTIERRMMEETCMYLVGKHDFDLEDIVPCQDGLMILKDLWFTDLLKEINANIKENYRFNLEFVRKPFDEAIDIPLFEDEVKTQNEWIDELSSKRLAVRLLEMRGDWIINNGGRVYVYHGDRWYDDTENLYKMRIFVSEDLYDDRIIPIKASVTLVDNAKETLEKMCRNATSCDGTISAIVKHALSKAKCVNNTFFDNNPYLLGFENGVMELQTKTFRPYKFDDYITLTTGYDYQAPNYELIATRKNKLLLIKIFDDIQPNLKKRKLLYQVLCSGLDGVNYQKFWFLNGKGGNGKGYLSRLMRRLLGKNFIYYPKEALLKKVEDANGASPDIADLEYKRFILFTEMGGRIRLTALRRMTGGDAFVGRQLNQSNRHFNLHATIGGEFNAYPDFDVKPEPADYRRIADFGFPTNWTDDPDKIGKEEDGIIYRKANPYFSSNKFIDEMYLIWLDILLDKYQLYFNKETQGITFDIPEEVRQATKKGLDDKNIFARIFNEQYIEDVEKKEDKPENRLYLGDVFNEIKKDDLYRDLSPTQKNEKWGRKEFSRWSEKVFGVKKDKNKKEYVLGYKRFIEVTNDFDPDV